MKNQTEHQYLQNMDPFSTLEMIILSEVIPSTYNRTFMNDILSAKMTKSGLFFRNVTQNPSIHFILLFDYTVSSQFARTNYVESCGSASESHFSSFSKSEKGDPNPPI